MTKITTFFSEISHQTLTNEFLKIAQITQIWHRAKFYFTRISNIWYLITVPQMKKIHLAIMEECDCVIGERSPPQPPPITDGSMYCPVCRCRLEADELEAHLAREMHELALL